MAENGKRLITFVISILGGFIGVALAINTLVFIPLNAAIAQECNKREMADSAIMESVDTKLDKIIKITTDTSICLASLNRQVDVNSKRLDRLETK